MTQEATTAEAQSQRRSRLLTLLFCVIAVTGQVGQNVSLPLWIDAGKPATCEEATIVDNGSATGQPDVTLVVSDSNLNCNKTWNCTAARSIDSYFVYTFACTSFVLIFGLLLLVQKLLLPDSFGETERRFPQRALFLIGFFDALNGVLVVFASSGKRTLPALQPILGNFMIPLTVLCRLLLLRKGPSRVKALCAAAVFLALIVSLVPTFIPSMGGGLSGGAAGIWKFLWPMIFMLGFVPAAVMNVLQEKWLKHEMDCATGSKQLNLIFFLFCTSCYQFLTAGGLFWVDIIPGYGNASSIQQLVNSWSFGIDCFFGGAGCSAATGVRGSSFIGMYTVAYIGGGLLMRYAEGATLLAIVSALVTPLGFLFWTFFNEDPFEFRFETGPITWFSLASLVLMLPAILIYNIRTELADPDVERQNLINNSDIHENHLTFQNSHSELQQ